MNTRHQRRMRGELVAIMASLMLFAASCGGGSAGTADTTDTAAPPENSAASASGEGSLVAPTVAGGQVDFGALEGQDVVLWFWAPW